MRIDKVLTHWKRAKKRKIGQCPNLGLSPKIKKTYDGGAQPPPHIRRHSRSDDHILSDVAYGNIIANYHIGIPIPLTNLDLLGMFILDPRQDAEHFHLILMKTKKQELSFTPETPSDQILKYYPGAIDSNELTRRFLNLVGLVYDLKPENIVLGQSVCSDDLNNIQFPPCAKDMLGPFNLGGLNGYPFTGLTGMGAFSHHYPECGALLIFYGPHIGIGREGIPGRVIRPGQTKPSTCCGAAAAALKKLEAGGIHPQVPVEPDYQQGTIEQIFLKQKLRITSAPREKRILVATEVMYQATHHQVRYLMDNTEFTSKYVFYFGGILINPDAKETSFIEVRDGFMVDVKTHETKEIKEEILAAV